MRVALTLYVAGVILGLWRTDGPPASRAVLALLWPLGPLAFLVTIVGLVMAAIVAFAGPKGRA